MAGFAQIVQLLQQRLAQPEQPQSTPGSAPQPGNPFASLMQRMPQGSPRGAGTPIPSGFFSSPQAQQMLTQLLGRQQPAPQRSKPPYVAPWAAQSQKGSGPAPDPATLMGAVGGLGNGGGKMGIQATRFVKGY